MTLLWTGTIRGAVEQCDCPLNPGGLARLKTLIDSQRATAGDVSLLLDLGDVAGDPEEEPGLAIEEELVRRVRADLAYELMATIGYDLYVPGERDLTLGAAPLVERLDQAGAQLLASNLWSPTQARPFARDVVWVATELGEIALLSVVQPLDQDQLTAAARGHDDPIAVIDAGASVALRLDAIEQRARFIILLAHGPTQWARELLEPLSDRIDLCLVAHDDADPRVVIPVGASFILQTAGDGKSLGRLDIHLSSDGTLSFAGVPLAPNNDVEPDPQILALVETLHQRLEDAQHDLNHANVGEPTPTGATYLGFAACGECHADVVGSWYQTDHVESFQTLQRLGFHVVPECFECHTTGFGLDSGFSTRALTPQLANVSCEACHGPASDAIEHMAGYGRADQTTCLRCHTAERSPGFDFDERWPPIACESEIVQD